MHLEESTKMFLSRNGGCDYPLIGLRTILSDLSLGYILVPVCRDVKVLELVLRTLFPTYFHQSLVHKCFPSL